MWSLTIRDHIGTVRYSFSDLQRSDISVYSTPAFSREDVVRVQNLIASSFPDMKYSSEIGSPDLESL